MINVSGKNANKLLVGDKKVLKIYSGEKEAPILIDWYRYNMKTEQVSGLYTIASFSEYGSIIVQKTNSLQLNNDLTFTNTSSRLELNTLAKWRNYFSNDMWQYTLLSNDVIDNSPFVYRAIDYDQSSDEGTAIKLTLLRVVDKTTLLIIQDDQNAHAEGWDGTYYWYKTALV